MAEVDVKSSGGKGAQKAGVKRTSTKVDMTAMVDLAFLLITFFMLTTTMAKPQTMEITMPDKQKDDQEETMKVKQSRTLTVLLGENDKVYWYQGVNDGEAAPEIQTTHFGKDGIRKALLQKKKEIGKWHNPKSEKLEDAIIVIIKAQEKAKYKNMVDILDEMSITGIGVYAIVDITQADEDLINVAKGIAPATPAAPAV